MTILYLELTLNNDYISHFQCSNDNPSHRSPSKSGNIPNPFIPNYLILVTQIGYLISCIGDPRSESVVTFIFIVFRIDFRRIRI